MSATRDHKPGSVPPGEAVAATVAGARRVTMTDVAKLAGVSQSSVSLALNDMTGARLSDATRQRVFDAARQLGYRLPGARAPAAAERPASSRRRTDVPLIVYLVDEISTSPHPVVSIDGAKDAAWEQGAVVAVFATRSNPSVEEAVFSGVLRSPNLVGVIYSAIFTREVRLPAVLDEVPTVLLNCYEAAPAGSMRAAARRSSIVPAEVAGGHAATERLIEAGHRRIAFINGEPWMDAAQDRLKGYRRALASADIPFDAALVREGDWQVASGYEHTRSLMREPAPPSAIFCANDLMAVGCLEALGELGVQVPAEVSVMGYDDQEISQHTHPPLSTLVLPSYEMGRLAVETLLAEVRDPQVRRRQLKVEGRLVERETVAAPGKVRGAGLAHV
jgi:LacI family transcriptional regulator